MKSFAALLFSLFVSYVSAAAVAGSRSFDLMPRTNVNCPVCDQLSPSLQACIKAQNGQDNQTDAVGNCQCSDAAVGMWRDCWSCGFAKSGLSSDGAQRGLDAITQACAAAGHPLSNPPKIDASSASASGAASGGASGSGSASSPSSTSGAVQIGTRHAVAVALALSGVVSALISA